MKEKVKVNFVLRESTINIISVHAPQIGLEESIKQKFWEEKC